MKFSKYNIVTETDYGLIIYNALNECYVKIKKETGGVEHFNKIKHSKNINVEDSMVKALYEKGYIVDNDVDEYRIAHEKIENYVKNLKSFYAQIYVTEQCNFRCVYCYEEHADRRLSDSNWEALYKHIENGVIKGDYKDVEFMFFGGEPLLELNKIEKFLEKLKYFLKNYPDVKASHGFTTNGYLLTPKVYDKLTKLGVDYFQITVDGFAEQHNLNRPKANGEGTWDKIIENLKYINSIEDDTAINYMIVCNNTNVNKLYDFVEWSKKTFNNPKIQISLTPAANKHDIYASNEEIENSEAFIKTFSNLDKTLKSFGKTVNTPFKLLGFVCDRAFPGHYTICTNGKLSKCAHYFRTKESYIGEFCDNGEIKFYENYKEWSTGFEFEECKECTYYPLCGGMSCVHKKVISNKNTRWDCHNVKEGVIQNLLKKLKEGEPDDINQRRRSGVW